MKKYLLVPIFILLLNACFLIKIERLESRKADDGSTAISAKDSSFIREFRVENFEKVQTIQSPNQIYFEIINYNNLKEVISRNERTLVTFWASWCPVCHRQLATYRKIVDSLSQKGIHSILIEQNFNILYSQQILFKDSIFFQTYILHDKSLGSDESSKQYRLLRNFDAQIKDNEGGVPSSVLFSRNGHILQVKQGLFTASDFLK